MAARRTVRPLTELAAAFMAAPAGPGCRLVAIDGRAGSGKTTLAERLARLAGGLPVLHMDDFYRPAAERPPRPLAVAAVGADLDLERVWAQVIQPLRAGRPARWQRYDWPSDALAEWHTTPPAPAVIVEGVYASCARLRGGYAYRIWVECPRELRLARGIARDGEGMRRLWVEEWIPPEDAYVAAERPDLLADAVVDASGRVPHDPENTYVRVD